MARPTFIDLNFIEYKWIFFYYPFTVNLNRCNGSCNTRVDTSGRICKFVNLKDVNLSIFNMTGRINESKTLTKHISCECKCTFDGRKCSSNQNWSNDKCRCECINPRKIIPAKEVMFGILVLALGKMVNI